VLGVIEIVPAQTLRFYNYEAKYVEGGSVHLLPARFHRHVRIGAEVNVDGPIKHWAAEAFHGDFRYDDTRAARANWSAWK